MLQAPDDAAARTRLAKATLTRLEQREELRLLASAVHRGITKAIEGGKCWVVGELDPSLICGPDPAHPDDTHRFDCGAGSFDCADFGGAFSCVLPQNDYGNCGGSPEFQCATDFDCGADIYDCHDYLCDEGFSCDETFDFLCGLDFDCQDGTSFDCTAGHVFFCTADHNCWDYFGCRSPGQPPCTNDYNWGGDQTSGDFTCGHPGPQADNFDCTDEFGCTAADDFDCLATTDFDCGNSLPGTDTFGCGGGGNNTNFDCEGSAFDCRDDFYCYGDYDCPSNYDCYDNFVCDPDIGCPPGDFTCSGTYTQEPLAITLLSFTATARDGSIVLRWETGSEIANEGFNVLRSTDPEGDFAALNGFLIPAEGGPAFGAVYEFVDDTVAPGITYYYMLEDIDTSGRRALHGADARGFEADLDCEPMEAATASAADSCTEHRIRRRSRRELWPDLRSCWQADWKDSEPDQRFPGDRRPRAVRARGRRALSCVAPRSAD